MSNAEAFLTLNVLEQANGTRPLRDENPLQNGWNEPSFSEVTHAHMVDLEASIAARGTLQWGATSIVKVVTELQSAALEAGVSPDGIGMVNIQLFARINAAVRQGLDTTQQGVTRLDVTDLALTAQSDWRRILRENIVAKATGAGQARMFLQAPPELDMGPGSAVRVLEHLDDLNIPTENGLLVAAGGGGDSYASAFAAHVLGQQDPTMISVWGDPDTIRNAEPIGDSGRIFRATGDTYLESTGQTRCFEDLTAARGLRTIMVCLERGPDAAANLYNDFRRVADYMNADPSHITVVDTGGDLLERSTLADARPSRDRLSLQAALRLGQRLGNNAGHTLVLVPGADAPAYMNEVAQTAQAQVYDLAPHAHIYQEYAEQDNLPSAARNRYSRMVEGLWYATHPRTLAPDYQGAVHPLSLPVDQALKAKRARPSFMAITPHMRTMHIYDTARLASTLGIA